MSTDRISNRLLNEMENIFATIDSLEMDDIQLKGLSIHAGNKVLKLKVVEVESIDPHDEIKKEYKQILNQKLSAIKDTIQKKVSDMVTFVQTYREEYERKEAELKKRLESSQIMPHITWQQAEKGLSVSPGVRKGEIYWYVRSVYWPKFVDMNPITPKFQQKLITPIIIMIATEGETVKSVSTRTPIGLKHFSHYHQQVNGDCWGRWKWRTKWNNPDDIISIAREAEGVLENVNTGSIAQRNPSGLPSLATLERHIDKRGTLQKEVDTTNSRVGITSATNINTEDSWST